MYNWTTEYAELGKRHLFSRRITHDAVLLTRHVSLMCFFHLFSNVIPVSHHSLLPALLVANLHPSSKGQPPPPTMAPRLAVTLHPSLWSSSTPPGGHLPPTLPRAVNLYLYSWRPISPRRTLSFSCPYKKKLNQFIITILEPLMSQKPVFRRKKIPNICLSCHLTLSHFLKYPDTARMMTQVYRDDDAGLHEYWCRFTGMMTQVYTNDDAGLQEYLLGCSALWIGF